MTVDVEQSTRRDWDEKREDYLEGLWGRGDRGMGLADGRGGDYKGNI